MKEGHYGHKVRSGPFHFQEAQMPKLVNTGVALPSDVHLLLRNAARGAQRAKGGRASVSALLADLVRRNEPEFHAMAQGDTERGHLRHEGSAS
jgi:hypothetical protein